MKKFRLGETVRMRCAIPATVKALWNQATVVETRSDAVRVQTINGEVHTFAPSGELLASASLGKGWELQ